MIAQNSTELEMFAFFEMTPDLVCIAGKDGFFKKINPAVIEKLGYTEAELFSKPISHFICSEDRDLTHNRRSELLNGKTLLNFVNRYETKIGAIVWLEWTAIYLSDKEVVFAIAKDVTERKIKEKDIEENFIKYQNLATHFKKAIEKDRKYLSYELHEKLAQLVSALKMEIDWVSKYFTGIDETTKSRIENASGISKMVMNTINKISFSLSPQMLYDFGLNATLEWLSNEFTILNGIPCDYETSIDESVISIDMKLDFFRICQESLTNIIKHANASKVLIQLNNSADKIELNISDNGNGFQAEKQTQTSGLTHIRELVVSLNGELNILSQPGEGTRICVSIKKQFPIELQHT